MMAELPKIATYEEMNLWTKAEVIAAFTHGLSLTAHGVVEMSHSYRICMEKEWLDDLPPLPGMATFLKHLPQISEGSVDGSIAIQCISNMDLFRQVVQLPIREQKRLANGGTLKLAVRNAHGEMDHREVPLSYLARNPDARKQLLDNGRTRPLQEQVVSIDREAPPVPVTDLLVVGNITVDRKRDGLIVGGKFVSRLEVEAALRELPTRKRKS